MIQEAHSKTTFKFIFFLTLDLNLEQVCPAQTDIITPALTKHIASDMGLRRETDREQIQFVRIW